MGSTFAALGFLVLVMVLLERIFRQVPVVEPSTSPSTSPAEPGALDDEIAAAIAVAIMHLRELEREQSGLGATLETGHGAWWTRPRTTRFTRPTARSDARSNGK
jgi:Na+-transporting methylmalonyl-CoA/oxaloacetate decarboxylase gamma subunit